VEFGLNPFNARKSRVARHAQQLSHRTVPAGQAIVLIVDDAHNLSLKVLEEHSACSRGLETPQGEDLFT